MSDKTDNSPPPDALRSLQMGYPCRRNGNAHYPQHQYISAYDSMFEVGGCMDNANKLLRTAYIQWHMNPYFCEADKVQKRIETYCGKEFYKNLMLLHEADKFAH